MPDARIARTRAAYDDQRRPTQDEITARWMEIIGSQSIVEEVEYLTDSKTGFTTMRRIPSVFKVR